MFQKKVKAEESLSFKNRLIDVPPKERALYLVPYNKETKTKTNNKKITTKTFWRHLVAIMMHQQFILKKDRGKLECLIHEMLLIKEKDQT